GQEITLEDVYAHTALTYPNTWVREMTGAEILQIMEDVADNLFHRDPYYRQGGDMVRLGGLTDALDPSATLGSRIRDLRGARRPPDPGRPDRAHGRARLRGARGPPPRGAVRDPLRAVEPV